MIIAKWSKDFESLYKGVDAQTVAEEIMSIGDSATPQQIVDKGRDETSELHKCFTWNNDEAADKWRKQEARQIVCHLVIQRPVEEEDKPEIRVFHKTDGAEGYKPATVIFRREDEYTALLQRALGELKAFQKKYRVLSDNEDLKRLIDSLESQIA